MRKSPSRKYLWLINTCSCPGNKANQDISMYAYSIIFVCFIHARHIIVIEIYIYITVKSIGLNQPKKLGYFTCNSGNPIGGSY